MEFSTRIANQLMLEGIQNKLSKNIVSSPLSINVALNMATAGSKGRTLERLLGPKMSDEINAKSRKMMAVTEGGGSSKDVSNGPILTMVNGAWVDQGFPLVDKYKEHILKDIFKGEANNVDFEDKANNGESMKGQGWASDSPGLLANEVVDEINSWANIASRGLIKNLLQHGSISRDTIVILANGLYFKGIWDSGYKFDAQMTKYRKFYLLNGRVVLVPFMTSKKKENYYYKKFDGFKVLKIPYQSCQANNFSMYFFLPDDRDGLQNLLGKFNSNSGFLNEKHFKLAKEELSEFWIPKFKFSFDFDVLKVMDDMGESLSSIENLRDLSEMMHISEDAPYFISKMVQKVYIEVDEKGTKATSIIGMGFRLMCERWPKISFVADHPFVCMIREEGSGLVLFTGTVMNPLQKG
ncbi:hypothetical protein Vadar_023810 [Vaccinium darrowii]|uniref:Uncharacterized protein n=1 Tax=Vaccinium darrowii TaxID=229202 RepID=A0ACB7Y8K3_9ERIC|nr:hypothetical protein Vadar_023810 [Vaccinium darrowii]